MSVIPYSNEAFEERFASCLIQPFSHGNFVNGSTVPDCARREIARLNERVKAVAPAISFHAEMVPESANQLTGGACSVISLCVAEAALDALSFSGRLARKAVNLIATEVRELNRLATSGNKNSERLKEARSRQQALNAIHVDRSLPLEHPVREKVKAIALLEGFMLTRSSRELRAEGNAKLQEELVEEMEKLSEGVHLLRVLQYAENHKLEVHGHTAVYVKCGGEHFYFDPAIGFYQFNLEEENIVFEAIRSALKRFQVDFLSFHTVQMGREPKFLTFALKGEFAAGFRRAGFQEKEAIIYYPARADAEAPYKRFRLLREGRIAESKFSSRAQEGLRSVRGKGAPVLIFSPGLGNTPDDYSYLIEEAASRGYVVIALSHQREGEVLPLMSEEEIISEGLKRAQEIALLAERIKDGAFQELAKQQVDPERIAAFGHSLGGSAAICACHLTGALKAAYNMDGRILVSKADGIVSQACRILIADREKSHREAFNAALASFQCARFSQGRIALRHGDFSLAPFYRRREARALNAQDEELFSKVQSDLFSFLGSELQGGAE